MSLKSRKSPRRDKWSDFKPRILTCMVIHARLLHLCASHPWLGTGPKYGAFQNQWEKKYWISFSWALKKKKKNQRFLVNFSLPQAYLHTAQLYQHHQQQIRIRFYFLRDPHLDTKIDVLLYTRVFLQNKCDSGFWRLSHFQGTREAYYFRGSYKGSFS